MLEAQLNSLTSLGWGSAEAQLFVSLLFNICRTLLGRLLHLPRAGCLNLETIFSWPGACPVSSEFDVSEALWHLQAVRGCQCKNDQGDFIRPPLSCHSARDTDAGSSECDVA